MSLRWCPRQVLAGVVCAAAAGAVIAAAWPGADALGASRSSPAGVALIARVNRAYTHVPAAIITVHVAGHTPQFTEILKGGVVAAESYTITDSTGTTVLVATKGSPTFERQPHTACWKTLARSDPQALDDIGHPLFYFPGGTIGTPRTTATGWIVTVTMHGLTVVVVIDKSRMVQSVTSTDEGVRAQEDFTSLSHAPKLPNPAPHC